jgi:hypothetical protein
MFNTVYKCHVMKKLNDNVSCDKHNIGYYGVKFYNILNANNYNMYK